MKINENPRGGGQTFRALSAKVFSLDFLFIANSTVIKNLQTTYGNPAALNAKTHALKLGYPN